MTPNNKVLSAGIMFDAIESREHRIEEILEEEFGKDSGELASFKKCCNEIKDLMMSAQMSILTSK